MNKSQTSATGKFGKAQAPVQSTCWVEIQLVDELGSGVANMPWRAENEVSRDKIIEPYSGITDSEGILRIDNLLHPDLTLFIEAQPLVNEMETRPLSLKRDTQYNMKMSPVTVDEITGRICYNAVVGQLCNKAPDIPGWNKKDLPAFHFPDSNFCGLTIYNIHFNSRVIVKVCPFRAWNVLLHYVKEYSIVNAYNLGLFSEFVYESKEKILNFFNSICLDLSQVPSLLFRTIAVDVPFCERYIEPTFIDTTEGDSGAGGTQLFFVSNQNQVIVAWRGTEPSKISDLITDATFKPTPCSNIISGGIGHKGFLDGFNMAKNMFSKFFERMESLSSKRDLFICGHSLGGALALIHAATLKNYKPILYTYGMPRIFTSSTVLKLQDITHFRHVNDTDSVTSVPPEYELDNALYNIWGPWGTIYGFYGSLGEIGLQAAGHKFGDPYWHHGDIVVFFKVQQSVVKKSTRLIPVIGADTFVQHMTIKKIGYKKLKLYLVPKLNDEVFCMSGEEQEKFVKCLDSNSMARFFPKNTNPDLDSISNPINHLMTSQYMPYIYNQLLELSDAERVLQREIRRSEFEKEIDNTEKLKGDFSKNEILRNRLFLNLQNMLGVTLKVSTHEVTWRNALIRFNETAEEQYESTD